MSPILKLTDISKTFHDQDASLVTLKRISLSIKPGEFFILLGPSGSGKSTLLRIMAGFDANYHGIVHRPATSDTSFVFQNFALLPWLTVYENIELGLLQHDMTDVMRRKRILREIKEFGLTGFANAKPKALSGGMRQRVGLARALATDPKILFMDEPFSELDSFTASELRKQLHEVWERRQMTIVMVTHNIQEAIELADRVGVLTPRPASLEAVVKIDLPRPRNNRSPEFFAIEDKLLELIKA